MYAGSTQALLLNLMLDREFQKIIERLALENR
jgi:hypothetical protein